MKSLVNDLVTVTAGILKDVSLAYPQLCGSLRKDLERLTRLARSRGIGFFTLDLPSLDSHLTTGLKGGRLDASGPLTNKVSKRTNVPRLFSGLWLRVFTRDACLCKDPDPTAILFLRQLFCLGKKLELECAPARRKSVLREYYDVEKEILAPTLAWDEDNLDPEGIGHSLHFCDLNRLHDFFGQATTGLDGQVDRPSAEVSGLLRRLQQLADDAAQKFSQFHPGNFIDQEWEKGFQPGFRHGPGAVSDRKGCFHKYDFTHWPDKLNASFPYWFCGRMPNDPIYERKGTFEHPSQLIAVPKTAKGPRLIAAEPTSHQWCQQLIKAYLERQIKKAGLDVFIDFRDQNASRELALRASLDGDLCTVDLSSASDRLSCWIVERMFSRNKSLLTALHASRTRWVCDRISDPILPNFFKPKKFASQGTAVTFPVQTIFFLLTTLASLGCERLEDAQRFVGQVRVFGDDIILPKAGYDSLSTLLRALRLKINPEKSCRDGLFREACGFDGYGGHCVTPVKPVSLSVAGPTLRASIVDFANNLFRKGMWHASKAVQSIAERHRFARYLPVVGGRSGVIGWTSFTGHNADHLRKRRWNAALCREEALTWKFTSKQRRKPTNDYPGLLQWFTEAPSPESKWEHGIPEKPKTSDGLRWEVLVPMEIISP